MGESRKEYKVSVKKPKKKKNRSEDQGIDRRMGSKLILGRLAGGYGMNSVGSG
jgi:hypothetical protein